MAAIVIRIDYFTFKVSGIGNRLIPEFDLLVDNLVYFLSQHRRFACVDKRHGIMEADIVDSI
jgi:hypothetical protein